MKENINEIFGMNVFNEAVMRKCLPVKIYDSLHKTMEEGVSLESDVADVVANAMKDWAIEKGATHYTHWFQPMTGITAEKHDSFINPAGEGRIVTEFSGAELIKGEPDASSFPSGGLRATFEARGYTAWDPTSYAFVKDGTLYIPTAFCSYSGEMLDKKTPMLRSMQALNTQGVRLLRAIGMETAHVTVTVGAEQEYFLVDRDLFRERRDLVFTGRTLFGARPPKGQELDDHYFGNLKERVARYMQELDEELWKLGVYAKTKHNEAAPAQHELACVYTTCNMAADHNQLVMEMMKKVADHHGLACLLHEKPFAGVNGSGKHNNWSLSTAEGDNLLKPGKNPSQNLRFLLVMSAVLKAVDEYGDLLRMSAATAGNDHRLGAHEAPPAIISIFLGDQITGILENIEQGIVTAGAGKTLLQTGVLSLPVLFKDTTDRNRTSPMAFTGNKFEFRMPGASQSISGINVVLNTSVAEALCQFADILEQADDVEAVAMDLVRDTYIRHKRIIFNGNAYSEEWVVEAARRGLPNLHTTVEAMPVYVLDKNIELFTKHAIFSREEVFSRYEIMTEGYNKLLNIEALTMLDMARREIIPACLLYSKMLFETLQTKMAVGLDLNLAPEKQNAANISNLTACLMEKTEVLETAMLEAKAIEDIHVAAHYYRDNVFVAMQGMRIVADELETLVSDTYWPFPTYADLLFSV